MHICSSIAVIWDRYLGYLSLQDLVQKSLQDKKYKKEQWYNSATQLQKHIKRHLSALRPPFLQSLKTSSASHTGATPTAKLAFTSINLFPWGGQKQVWVVAVVGGILACYLTTYPCNHPFLTVHPNSWNFIQSPFFFPALSDPAVSLNWAPLLWVCVCIGDFLIKMRPLKHTVFVGENYSFFPPISVAKTQLMASF